ncbi:MAG: serine/threonine-protein kinase [Myxococcota bacterium]
MGRVFQGRGPTTDLGTTTGPVAEAVVRDTQDRLRAFLILTGLVMCGYYAAFVTVWREHATLTGYITNTLLVPANLGAAFWLRKPRPVRGVAALAIVLLLLLSVGMTLPELEDLDLTRTRPSREVPTATILVLLTPFLVPVRPRALLVLVLSMASVLPLGFLVRHLAGHPVPSSVYVISLIIPLYVCALMAWLLARVVYRLGREAGRARKLGAYELEERLGAGGMGEVWRAKHRFLVRPAAVKLIQPAALAEPERRGELLERFEREAQATAALESPHTVDLYDFGVAEDGTLYYVMEYLRGIDLQTCVERFGPLPPARVAFLLAQACESLAEAHRLGLVHRDVKPANLQLCRLGDRHDFVKVLDFGLVKLRSAEGQVDASLTQEGRVQGTPAYLAPEAIDGSAPVGAPADIYALGCVAYFLLTGDPVFEGATPVAIAAKHLHEVPPPPSARLPEPVPEALEAVVMACLEKRPDARPADGTALALELHELARELQPSWGREDARSWWQRLLPELAEVKSAASTLRGRTGSMRPTTQS